MVTGYGGEDQHGPSMEGSSSTSPAAIRAENERLRQELAMWQQQASINQQSKAEMKELRDRLDKERHIASVQKSALFEKQREVDVLKNKMIRLQREMTGEKGAMAKVTTENMLLEKKLLEAAGSKLAAEMLRAVKQSAAAGPPPTSSTEKERSPGGKKATMAAEGGAGGGSGVVRTFEEFLRRKDLSRVSLAEGGVDDYCVSVLCNLFKQCKTLSVIDLSRNALTNTAAKDLAPLLSSLPTLSYLSLAANNMSPGAVGPIAVALMERLSSKGQKMAVIEMIDMQGQRHPSWRGSISASEKQREGSGEEAEIRGAVGGLLDAVGKEVWAHVVMMCKVSKNLSSMSMSSKLDPKRVEFQHINHDELTALREAMSKIVLAELPTSAPADTEDESEGPPCRVVTADWACRTDAAAAGGATEGRLPEIQPKVGAEAQPQRPQKASDAQGYGTTVSPAPQGTTMQRMAPGTKEKAKTFRIRQIVNKAGHVNLAALDKSMETTSIEARDVDTGETLLESACRTGNLALAKLCYRRGAALQPRAPSVNAPFTVAAKYRHYSIMEFLHHYGVKVNAQDGEGKTALHVATSNNDLDAICRLMEWGAEVNVRDKRKRTPLHFAAIAGHPEAALLLLELGADLNAKDEKECTAVAHAEAHDHFALMDRLIQLGGKDLRPYAPGAPQHQQGMSHSPSRPALATATTSQNLSAGPTSSMGSAPRVAEPLVLKTLVPDRRKGGQLGSSASMPKLLHRLRM
ncbi:unnamed protein product [Vitrella brassicaformis CCMP3155]|uniref:Uncharacterized protein n=2 Tax=Vitrella brassicaformis TaxID=1169539 RepID=A0A0G4ESV3_VITBC|nr:unnamed protein product [Vitrella brassicaformis CCMP3155]|eukprot:CEM01491.1 unnamed protein product [Vitrella brassicaformis CCMP3155]